jgi:hypothetical protein
VIVTAAFPPTPNIGVAADSRGALKSTAMEMKLVNMIAFERVGRKRFVKCVRGEGEILLDDKVVLSTTSFIGVGPGAVAPASAESRDMRLRNLGSIGVSELSELLKWKNVF